MYTKLNVGTFLFKIKNVSCFLGHPFRLIVTNAFFLTFHIIILLLRRSISDHYLRSCGYVTCSKPKRTATGGFEPGTSRPKVLGFTTAPVCPTFESDFYSSRTSSLRFILLQYYNDLGFRNLHSP